MVGVCDFMVIYYIVKKFFCDFKVNKIEVIFLIMLVIVVKISLIKVIFLFFGIDVKV